MDQSRQNAMQEMIASVGQSQWDKNMQFLQGLISMVKNHKINKHPIIDAMKASQFSL